MDEWQPQDHSCSNELFVIQVLGCFVLPPQSCFGCDSTVQGDQDTSGVVARQCSPWSHPRWIGMDYERLHWFFHVVLSSEYVDEKYYAHTLLSRGQTIRVDDEGEVMAGFHNLGMSQRATRAMASYAVTTGGKYAWGFSSVTHRDGYLFFGSVAQHRLTAFLPSLWIRSRKKEKQSWCWNSLKSKYQSLKRDCHGHLYDHRSALDDKLMCVRHPRMTTYWSDVSRVRR